VFTPAVGGARFYRLTGRDALDPSVVSEGVRTGASLLRVLDRHLAARRFLAAEALTVADLSLYA
jgi:glutathione S-transferase